MKLKGRIRYRRRWWQVFLASEREMVEVYKPQRARADQQVLGICDVDTATVYLWSGLSPLQRRKKFFHELVEAANHEAGIGLTHGQIEKLERELGALIVAPL